MSAPFVTSLGVRPDTIRLVDGASPASPRDSLMTLRVRGAEVWDGVRVEAAASTPVRNIKQAALAVLMPDVDTPDLFVVKLQGSELRNESLSLTEAGVKNGATLLVMSRRRHAVR